MALSVPVCRAVAAASLLALMLGAGAGVVVAADPSGSPLASPSERPGGAVPDVQIWQDEALPPDVPEGRTIDVGFTAWDATGGTLFRVGGAQVRVHPKTGKAKPIEAFTRTDWPGHLVAPITIPKGGLGTIEVGVTAQECHDDTGKCNDVFMPFAWGGVGPPPDASRALLVEASIRPPAEPLIAGQPFEVVADVTPRAAWGADALALPTQLVVVARAVRGSEYSLADLNGKADGPYSGSIVIPRAGDVVLIVGFPKDGGDPDLVDASIFRVTIEGPNGEVTPAPSRVSATAPLPSGDSLPVVPIALVLVAVIAGGVVVTRALSDL